MATSIIEGKAWIRELYLFVNQFAPIKRVLDIGPGSGTYVKFLRTDGQEWVGVEIWGPFLEKFALDKLYDKVILSDACYVDYKRLGKFDCAIMGDVLEHMTKEAAVDLVDRLLEHVKIAIISIPVVHAPQGRAFDNPYETHVKDDWSDGEVKDAFPHIHASSVEGMIGSYALSKDPMGKTMLTQFQTLMAKAQAGGGA